MKQYKSVDEYIESFPEDVQEILQKLRKIVKDIAPDAVESISYGMPAYKLAGRAFVYFAANKKHIGFYPTPSGTTNFEKELAEYKTGKGTAQFPYDKPVPYSLVKKIVEFRKKENLEKYGKKK